MEYGLWHWAEYYQLHHFVLILVLMEYGLWQIPVLAEESLVRVLILVLMEYGLWPDPNDPYLRGHELS